MKIKSLLKKIINNLLAILFPVECLGCQKEDVYLCDNCLKGIPLHQTIEPFNHPLQYLDSVLTATDYQNEIVQKAIHYFKFRYLQELAKPLSNLLIKYYENIRRLSSFDQQIIIIPVPLHKKRYLERGFNQSKLIAQIFADYFGLMMRIDIIERCRNTRHQVSLNKEQKTINIKQAFRVIKPATIKNKNIILIDDVITTGATLEEMAKVLKENGAKKIYGLTVAKD